jgi:16S rRNA (cytosine967-C5)-methyltransferase
VREGGLLVYSTCTIFHEENEDVVETFLSEHRAFKLDSLVEVLPEKCHLFIKKGYLKTFPPAGELDGFFAARLRKAF